MSQEGIDKEPNITLHVLTAEDAETYFNLVDENREYFARHGNMPTDKYRTVSDIRHAIENSGGKLRWAIRNANGDLVGTINMRPMPPYNTVAEIGYLVGEKYAGKGYATQAVVEIANNVSNKYSRLFATTDKENTASQRVLEKAGFVEMEPMEEGVLFFQLELHGGLR